MLSHVSLTLAKRHLRVEFDDDDEFIMGLVAASLEAAQDYTGQVFALQTEVEEHEQTAQGLYWLQTVPIRSVLEINAVDTEGASAGVVEDFTLYVRDGRARLKVRGVNAPMIRVNVLAGYPDDSLPTTIRQAVLFTLAHFYENRSALGSDKLVELPLAVKHLLNPHRVRLFAGA